MKRRRFITLLGGAAVAWPLAARAQQAGKLPTVGFLGTTTPSIMSQWTAAFVGRLRELGWIEGRTIKIEYGWAEGRGERYAEIAAEFVRLNVDVIVTTGPAATQAKKETSVIPIVLALSGDPVGAGLVASLARPGGNITGRLAIMVNVGFPNAVLESGEVQAAAGTLGLEVLPLEIRQAQDIAPAFEALKDHADALYVCTDALLNANRIRINTLALGARLPTMHGYKESVEAGGLMSYGANLTDLFRRAGDYVDKILRGAKPGDIPVEQPIKFDLVINLTTAKALGLTVPPSLLARADEVIE
jgi:ABC-type uncharacterized transport system substrate-binding protein